MNAIELLEKQHREVEKLFRRCERAEGDEKRALFEQIADALAVHATIEEQQFYPSIKTEKTEEQLYEAVEEHLSAKRIIADLLELDPEDESFAAKVSVLKEQVLHHVEEEEGELFPKVRRMFDDDALEDLGLVMEDLAGELEQGAPREAVPQETAQAAPL